MQVQTAIKRDGGLWQGICADEDRDQAEKQQDGHEYVETAQRDVSLQQPPDHPSEQAPGARRAGCQDQEKGQPDTHLC